MKRIIVEVTEQDKANFESQLKKNGKNMADTIRSFVRLYGAGKVNIISEDKMVVLGEKEKGDKP